MKSRVNPGKGRIEATDPIMEAIFKAALEKYRLGEQKYGPYHPLTDGRDMITEAEEEILDAINYLGMFLIKLRAMKKNPGE